MKHIRMASAVDGSRPGAGGMSRRALLRRATVAGGLGLLLPAHAALAQQSPPIEPIEPAPGDQTPIAPDPPETPPVSTQPPIEQQTPEDGVNDVDYQGIRYFAETGHNLAEPFLTAWRAAGGESVLGLPLSEERFVTDAGIQQAFQGITLWYRPDAAGDTPVAGLPLASGFLMTLAPAAAQQAVDPAAAGREPGSRYFPETGHSIAGDIAAFWNAIDGARLLGRPVSEAYREGSRTRQVFECAVVEMDGGGKPRLWHVVEERLLDDTLRSDPAFQPAPPTLGVTSLVNADNGASLRDEPSADGDVRAVIEDNGEFIAAPGEHGDWVPGYVDGQSGWVAARDLSESKSLPTVDVADWDVRVWQGAALGDTNVRQSPTTQSRKVSTLPFGTPVVVVDWVEGEAVIDDDDCWARLRDDTYMYVRYLGRSAPVAAPPLPADAPTQGRWIDVHLTQQLMVAYEGRTPQRVTVMTSGRPGWDTPAGMFHINTRVANETMESGSIGAESFYVLKDVLYTQYFTDVGHALHFAWWKTKETIGRPGSHGCLNLLLDDAKYYWDWADIGTPVYCHY